MSKPHHFRPSMSRRNARNADGISVSCVSSRPRQGSRVWCWLGLFCVGFQRFGLVNGEWTRQGRDMMLDRRDRRVEAGACARAAARVAVSYVSARHPDRLERSVRCGALRRAGRLAPEFRAGAAGAADPRLPPDRCRNQGAVAACRAGCGGAIPLPSPSADAPTVTPPPAKPQASKVWAPAAARRLLRDEGKISDDMEQWEVAELLAAESKKAVEARLLRRALKASYIENQLRAWNVWPLSSLK